MALALGSSLVDTCTNYLPASESHKISKNCSKPLFIGATLKKTVTFGCSTGSVQAMNRAGIYSPLAGLQSDFFSLFIYVFFLCFF